MVKIHKLGLCGHFRNLKATLKLKLQTSNFTDKDYIEKIYPLQFETCQTYHFQVTGHNM